MAVVHKRDFNIVTDRSCYRTNNDMCIGTNITEKFVLPVEKQMRFNKEKILIT